jgi:hypothetical protein
MLSILTSASLLALVASTTALPSTSNLRYAKRQAGGPGVDSFCTLTSEPSVQDVSNALGTWLNDVENVNNFLNIVGGITDPNEISGLAQGALDNALDEPLELNVLSCIPALGQNAAIDSAAGGFMTNVLMPLMDVVVNGANPDQVAADLLQINTFRCCTLLPDLDSLWEAAAADEGLVGSVDITVPRPDACAVTSC